MKTFNWKIGGKVEFVTAFDTNYYSDRALLHYANSNRIPEPEVVNFMLKVLKPGDVAIDGGASLGFFTLLMAKLVGPTGKVHAFEPLPSTAARFRKNIDLNDLGNVELYQNALGAGGGAAQFWEKPDDGQSALWLSPDQASAAAIEVGVRAIDWLEVQPKLIKLDIEGAEALAVNGADETLVQSEPFVICELNETALEAMKWTSGALRQAFSNIYGYRTFILIPNGSLPICVPDQTRLRISRANTNVLFAPLHRLAELWPELDIA